MRINWINCVLASLIAGLLAWWLWTLGITPTEKWLLASVGGFFIEVGFIGSMGIKYEAERSGVQVRMVFSFMAIATFVASCIYSFLLFSPEGYCIPLGIFGILCFLLGLKIYRTKE